MFSDQKDDCDFSELVKESPMFFILTPLDHNLSLDEIEVVNKATSSRKTGNGGLKKIQKENPSKESTNCKAKIA